MKKKKKPLVTFQVSGTFMSDVDIEVEAASEKEAREKAVDLLDSALGRVTCPCGSCFEDDPEFEILSKDICVLCGKKFKDLDKKLQRIVRNTQCDSGVVEEMTALKVPHPDGDFFCPNHRNVPKKVKNIMLEEAS